MSRRLAAVLILFFVPVICPAAWALEPGVHVDPGSPAGKEYALPLEAARLELFGGRTQAGGSAASTSTPSGHGASTQTGDGTANPASRGGGSASLATRGVPLARIEAAEAIPDRSPGAATDLLALAVVVVGGAVGLGLRRATRR